MLVTINSDASYRHDYKFGSFAYWIRCDTGKLFERGPLKGEIQDSSVAEFMAIIKAVHRLEKSTWNKIDRIIVNTDCLTVIKYMEEDSSYNSNKKLEIKFAPLLDIYTKLINKEKLKNADIEFRHVKAHVKDKRDARTFTNDWCDKAAKLSMKEMIDKHKKEMNQPIIKGETKEISQHDLETIN